MRNAALPVLILLLMRCASAGSPQPPTTTAVAFRDVTVIDVEHGRSAANMTVVVENDRITQVAKSGEVRIPRHARLIDGKGKFLMPGLWDMHVHMLSKERWDTFPALFVVNGVTGVRDMATSTPLADLAQLRRDIAAGTLVGPRFVASGPILDGPKPVNPTVSTPIADPDEGRRAVRLLKEQGADFIKVYTKLSRESYFAIASEAKNQGLDFVGHVPPSISAAEASEAGQKSMEHMFGVLEATADDEERLRALAAGSMFGQLQSQAESIDSYNREKAARLFALLAKNRTWQTPTVTVRHVAAWYLDTPHSEDRRLMYVYRKLRTRWTPETASFAKFKPELYTQLKRLMPVQLEIIRDMVRAGVPVLAGTDTGAPNVYPGFSLHDELAYFVRGGLTPLESLQTATINPARFLGLADQLGTVEKGKIADLVLLDGDPLADIANTKKIRAVVANGRLLDRATLDKTLEDVEAAANRE